MNAAVIVGLLLFLFPSLILAAGFASGNIFLNLNVDTDRRSAPATFWAVAVMWALIAAIGLAVAVVGWGR